MIAPLFRYLLLALLPILTTSCRTLALKSSKPDKPVEFKEVKIPIGTIHHVDAEGGFVLIQSGRTFKIEPETEITAVGGAGEITSILRVSPARKGSFLSADILNGIPLRGQKVLMDHTPRPATNPFELGQPGNSGQSEIQVLE